MKQENRHQAILYAVMRQGYVSIESLAEELGVSSQTIRRDISELDRTGMLERRPGGASCRTTILNSTYDARQVEDFKDKERIARTIAEYIPDNSSIFLTLGTTVEVIAYALLERSGLMVITNNVVAAHLEQEDRLRGGPRFGLYAQEQQRPCGGKHNRIRQRFSVRLRDHEHRGHQRGGRPSA